MKALVYFPLNIFFFALYGIVGLKIIETTPYSNILYLGDSLSWNELFLVVVFFVIIAFASVSTTYSVLAGFEKSEEFKTGNAEDVESPEVTPDVEIDGREETPDNLIDIIDDKTGRVFTQKSKPKKKKK